MKRFYIAIVLLIIISASATILNITLENKADELIKVAENLSEKELISWWEANGGWFDALLHDDLTSLVYLNIEKIKDGDNDEDYKTNIITGAKKIKDSIKVSIENIF